MTGEDPLLTEISALRKELRDLKIESFRARSRHSWLRLVVKDLETSPDLQYTVHKWGMYYWLFNFAACSALFFFSPSVWLKWGLYITLMYSIYANFATDYGAMSAAMAAAGNGRLIPIPAEPPQQLETGDDDG